MRYALMLCVAVVTLMASAGLAEAQQGGRGEGGPGGRAGAPGPGRGGPPPTAKAAAAFDLSGTWVAVVTEDWRWRMVTPPKNDVASVPLNAEGRKVAAAWDLDQDNASGNQCRAFGAGGIMRQPTRVQISWQDDQTLKLDTDAGQQTRLFRFVSPAGATTSAIASSERTWQGISSAEWVKQAQSRGLGFGGRGGGGASGGSLKVVTTNMKAGYLRKNGVPYSEDAVVTEHFNRHSGPGDLEWFTVTTVVEDPKYLAQPFITSTSFRREADNSKWKPTPCQTAPPTAAPLQPAAGPGR
ncbi:MAG TPA: hypothetical protein VFS23_27010 [Vicinamibacterales bacterium]|nr:hypothetical protein [Vicinamibacterales bacterium]